MHFLGIETSGVTTGVALLSDGRVVFEESHATGARHNESLVGLIRSAMKVSGAAVSGLEGIGVVIGPGMFTSLRVGLAVAKGIAMGARVPVKAIGTLEALAAAVGTQRSVLALVDARRQEVYAALFQSNPICSPTLPFGSAETLLGPACVAVSGIADWLEGVLATGSQLVLAGSGSRLCCESLTRRGFAVEDAGMDAPPARLVAEVAWRLLKETGPDDVTSLEPVYLRRTDAEVRLRPKT